MTLLGDNLTWHFVLAQSYTQLNVKFVSKLGLRSFLFDGGLFYCLWLEKIEPAAWQARVS